MRVRRALVLALALIGTVGLASCGDDDEERAEPGEATEQTLTIYSGRSEALVRPLFEQFTRDTGIKVEARYGDSAALAAQLTDEGGRSPADVFFSQDAGALGAVAKAGLLAALPQPLLDRVDPAFRAHNGTWIGTSGRARVAVINPTRVPPPEVPATVFDLADPKWKGRLALAPTNASFQSFVTAMRLSAGDERTRQWLKAIDANDPKIYEGNALVVRAVNDGEADIGLVNHYYRFELGREIGQDKVVAANHFFTREDPGALVNVAGVGILSSAPDREAADRFVDYLLQPIGQRYFAERTFEYPVIAGVNPSAALPPLAEVRGPNIDLSDLDDIEATLAMLRETGLL